ncbi:2130_t:CDS:2 [Paraglomus occultum]|uniref:2130_t:CDS:1 n=1 Tax=Paraglomus occultum TaxID=144539 RepID=A0A9N8ZE86_9GLOM|nr:2130_t:CDS:2 [Paraglomus occultum]
MENQPTKEFEDILSQSKQTEAVQEDIILDEPKGALKKFCIKKTEYKGRGIYALETIQRGTSIWQALPFSAVVDDQNISNTCSSCFVNDKRMFKCSKCSLIHYCSKQCQIDDWQNHQEECKAIVKVQRNPPTFIRLASRILRKRKVDVTLSQMETFAQLAMVVKECVGRDELLPAVDMLTLFCRLTSNGFSVLDAEMQSIGVGIYPNVSLLNHSCWPNCIVVFEGLKMNVRSIRKIEIGEEVTISYTDLFLTGEERRKELHERYFFTCRCELCEKYKSVSEVDPRSALRCTNTSCANPVDQPSTFDKDEEYVVSCNCGKVSTFDMAALDDSLEKARSLFKKGSELSASEPENALTYLHQAFLIQQSLLYFANHELVMTHRALFDCDSKLHKWDEALQHAECLERVYNAVFPEYHPDTALQIYRVAKILLYTNQLEKAVTKLRKALKISEVTCGHRHKLTRVIETSLKNSEAEIAIAVLDKVLDRD